MTKMEYSKLLGKVMDGACLKIFLPIFIVVLYGVRNKKNSEGVKKKKKSEDASINK